MFNNCTQSPTCNPCAELVVISASFPSLLDVPAHIPQAVGVVVAKFFTGSGNVYNAVRSRKVAVPVPVPTPVAVNTLPIELSCAPINVKSVVAPPAPSSTDTIVYSVPITNAPAVSGADTDRLCVT